MDQQNFYIDQQGKKNSRILWHYLRDYEIIKKMQELYKSMSYLSLIEENTILSLFHYDNNIS